MDSIDLAQKSSGPETPCCAPSQTSDSVHYPSLYIDLKGDALKNLPDEGTMVIRYKVCSRNSSERDGRKTSGVSIDVKEIIDATGSKEKGKSREDELDALAAEEKGEDEE